eukprot:jgi/Bigna1/131781/aug1.15_g6489
MPELFSHDEFVISFTTINANHNKRHSSGFDPNSNTDDMHKNRHTNTDNCRCLNHPFFSSTYSNRSHCIHKIIQRRELSEDSSSDDFENSWVYQHTVNRPFLCEVNPEWIRDTFNLNGLSTQIPHYEICLRRILDYEVGFDKLPPKKQAELEACCETLYGLVHARYITSPEGLDRMRQKYERGDFGACPRALCKGFRLLPVGITDELRLRPVKTFCPNCKELYHVRVRHAATIDGAFYTRTFPHMFLLKYPHLQPKCQPVKYQPTIFGFNVKYPDLPTADDYALQEKAKLEKEQAEARAKEEQAERGKDEEKKEENGSVDPNATSKKEQASQEAKPKAGEPQPTSLLPGVPMDNQTVQPQDAEMKGRDQDPPAQNSSPVQTRT